MNNPNTELFDLYTVIGDGTTVNLLALLTGLFEQELPESRKSHTLESAGGQKSGKTVLDDYPWVWDVFRRLGGYATHYIEDTPKWGTFQHRLVGFGTKKAPTDSYGRTCLLAALQDEHYYGKTLGCVHSR